MSRLERIEELEDNINDKLQVILATSQNCNMAAQHPISYDGSIAIHKDLQTIESYCKELAKLTAKAVGKLRAYDKLLEGNDE